MDRHLCVTKGVVSQLLNVFFFFLLYFSFFLWYHFLCVGLIITDNSQGNSRPLQWCHGGHLSLIHFYLFFHCIQTSQQLKMHVKSIAVCNASIHDDLRIGLVSRSPRTLPDNWLMLLHSSKPFLILLICYWDAAWSALNTRDIRDANKSIKLRVSKASIV